MKDTTVTIDQETSKKLDRLSQASRISKKEFIKTACLYFEKHGINPAEHESPLQEMERLRKRVDQVVTFIRAQERDKINPMFEAITATEARIKTDLDAIVKKENHKELINALNKVFAEIMQGTKTERETTKAQAEKTTAQNKKIADGLLLIAECLESGKDRKGLAGAIKNIFGA